MEVRLSFGSGPWGLGSPRYSGRSGPYAVHVLVFDLALVFGAGRSMMVPVPWRSDGRGGPLSIFDAVALGILCVDNDNDNDSDNDNDNDSDNDNDIDSDNDNDNDSDNDNYSDNDNDNNNDNAPTTVGFAFLLAATLGGCS